MDKKMVRKLCYARFAVEGLREAKLEWDCVQETKV